MDNVPRGLNRLVILDRDGVINHDSDAYVKTVDEWQPIDGSVEAIGALCQAGFVVAVATNQSGLARGYFDAATLDAMHAKMQRMVAKHGGRIAHIAYCPHGPDDGCDCRKPLPGLIKQIETQTKLSAQGSFMVGDSIRDLQAGVSAGCTPVLVKTGKGQKSLAALPDYSFSAQTLVADNLAEFVSRHLLSSPPVFS